MGVQPFDGKRPPPLLCAGSGNARGTVSISGISNPANYYSTSIIYKCSRGPHSTNWRASGWRLMV